MSPELSSYENRTLYSTWQLSFDQIQRQNKQSAALLRLWAYFDSRDIWLELLQSYVAHGIEWIYEVTKDELSFSHTIRTLSNYGLVEVDFSVDELIESRGYSVHSCVHSWMTHVLNQEWSIDLARFAISCIASHVPDQESGKWWLTQKRLLPHAGKYSDEISGKIIGNDMSWVCQRLAHLYSDQGKLKEAKEMYQRALRGSEKALGPDHTSTLDAVDNLGVVYVKQAKLKKAEEMCQRALRGYEKALGPNHTSTCNTVNNLGNLYQKQGKLKEAEEMYQRALRGDKKALGPNHTSTCNTVNNLGNLYQKQGKLKEAEEMYQRALRGYEKALGPNHTSTFDIVNNLGSLYQKQGKLKEAEDLCQRALQGYQTAYGLNHPKTQNALYNLQQLQTSKGTSL
jgi:tetratricopeptide (TPR) repeat protein